MTHAQISAKIECILQSDAFLSRAIADPIRKHLSRGRSILLLGPRQTGKSTLMERFPADLSFNLLLPGVRQRYEIHPDLLAKEVEAWRGSKAGRTPVILLDEIQKVPMLLDVVQHLHDSRKGRFLLTGSSARKLKRGGAVNLLPGRILAFRLHPLSLGELPEPRRLEDLLLYGSLPAIYLEADPEIRQIELKSYVETYLEEEVRSEALVRNLGPFARFLELAAAESGRIAHFSKLSREIGVAHTTIASYYQILEDCLIAERIEPLTRSRTRRKLVRSSRYLFFDMGVRRLAAGEDLRPPREILGDWFEQWVGLEVVRWIQSRTFKANLRFWKDPDGPEVDWVLVTPDEMIAVEVKWSEAPAAGDARHLKVFMSEYPECKKGLVVCRTPRPFSLGKGITAIPWQDLLDHLS